MKVLMLTWEFPPYITGGLGRHVAELSPALAKQGVDIYVLAPAPEIENTIINAKQQLETNLTVQWVNFTEVDKHIDVYNRVQYINQLMLDVAKQLWEQIGGFDLIHAHDWLVAPLAINLKKMYNCPLIATIHATEQGRWREHFLPTDLSRKINEVEHQLAIESSHTIACSQYMIDELKRLFGIPINKLDMIPNGINLDDNTHYPPAELANFRQQYVSPEQSLIFSVGRLVYEKGYQVLLNAMAQVLAQIPNTKLVLAGKGPLLENLQAISNELGISDHIYFAGFITDDERNMLYSVANCAVFPSLYEPFGIVALEAMAHNCPVVVSNVGGLVEVVEHEKTGILTYADNSNSVAWGILHVLNNPNKVTNYIENARHAVKEKFSWQHIALKTKQVYQQIAE